MLYVNEFKAITYFCYGVSSLYYKKGYLLSFSIKIKLTLVIS